jgi:hypothetical protein
MADSRLDNLVNLKYAGNVQFLFNGEYIYAYHPGQGNIGAPFPWHFFLTPESGVPRNAAVNNVSTVFRLEVGGHLGIPGYWVRFGEMAWQANPGKRMSFWNEWNEADGNPEDTELFYFEIMNAAEGTVRIKSRYCKYLRLASPPVVGWTHEVFDIGAEAGSAAPFKVVFS